MRCSWSAACRCSTSGGLRISSSVFWKWDAAPSRRPDVIALVEVDGMAVAATSPAFPRVAPFGLSRRPAARRAPAFNLYSWAPCHAPAARSAGGSLRPGARRGGRRRVRAGRPGLKTYRKLSPATETRQQEEHKHQVGPDSSKAEPSWLGVQRPGMLARSIRSRALDQAMR